MAILGPLLFGVTLSGLVALVVLAAGRRVLAPSERGGRQAAALAIGLAYVAGHVALARPGWPPLDVTDRIPFLVLGVLVLGLLEATWPAPAWAAWENRLLASLATVVLILGPAVQESWGTRETTVQIAGLTAFLVLAWSSLEALAARIQGAALVLPLFLVAAGATVVIVLAGYSMVLVSLAAALTAALAGCAVMTAFGPALSLARGGVPVVVLALGGLLVDAHYYASAPGSSVLLLGLATSAPWLVRLGPLRRLAGWKATLVSVAFVVVPVGIAVALAFAARPESEY